MLIQNFFKATKNISKIFFEKLDFENFFKTFFVLMFGVFFDIFFKNYFFNILQNYFQKHFSKIVLKNVSKSFSKNYISKIFLKYSTITFLKTDFLKIYFNISENFYNIFAKCFQVK